MGISPYLAALRAKVGKTLLLTPGVTGVVINADGQVLAMQTPGSPQDQWYLIGGAVEPGEELPDAVIREVFEEAGIRVRVERLTSVNSEPLMIYDNGDQMSYLSFCFLCSPLDVRPELHAFDGEASALWFFAPDVLLPLLTAQDRHRLEQALTGNMTTHFFFNEQPPYLPYKPDGMI